MVCHRAENKTRKMNLEEWWTRERFTVSPAVPLAGSGQLVLRECVLELEAWIKGCLAGVGGWRERSVQYSGGWGREEGEVATGGLVRMWNKGNISPLLAGLQPLTAVMEISVAVPQEDRN